MVQISLSALNEFLQPLGITAIGVFGRRVDVDSLRRPWELRSLETGKKVGISQSNGSFEMGWQNFKLLLATILNPNSEDFVYLEDSISFGDIIAADIYRGCSSLEEMQIKKDLLANG